MRGWTGRMAWGALLTLPGLAALGSCGARSALEPYGAHAEGETGPDGAPLDDAGREAAPPVNECADAGTTYIYLIDETNALYSWFPETQMFTYIGPIRCPDPDPTANPFSMAVDHKGVAYTVFYPSGNLFRVSTKTAACEATSYVPPGPDFTFGMGFVATVDDAGVAGEALFVTPDSTSILDRIDLTDFTLHEVGPLGLDGTLAVTQAELTGTGDGRLFGFFAPAPGSIPSYIAQIDPRTAAVTPFAELSGVEQGGGWAFGFWGGDFYTFTAPDGVTSVITRYRPSDGSVTQIATAPQGVVIVGAGVSTCAPQE